MTNLYKTGNIIPVISRAFLISSVSSIPVTLIPVNGSFPYIEQIISRQIEIFTYRNRM